MPLRSERDAFRLDLGFVLTAVVAVAIGLIFGALWGVIFAAAVVLIALVLGARAGHGEHVPILARAERAQTHPAAAPGREHVLVVANAPLRGEQVKRAIAKSERSEIQIDILAPLLHSRFEQAVSDVDGARADARRRLDESLNWARRRGLDARGRVGDEDLVANLADELQMFGADRVVVVTHPPDEEAPQESRQLERLREELSVPVTRAVVAP